MVCVGGEWCEVNKAQSYQIKVIVIKTVSHMDTKYVPLTTAMEMGNHLG